MRCHIECNEEVLCILVNSCAKHVQVFLQEHSPDLVVAALNYERSCKNHSSHWVIARPMSVPEETCREGRVELNSFGVSCRRKYANVPEGTFGPKNDRFALEAYAPG